MQHNKIFRYFLAIIILATASFAWAGLRGDVNGDGKVGLEDTIYSLQVISGVKLSDADGVHTGVIFSDEIWYAKDNPHIISETLTVAGPAPEGATLTIEPGVEVRFEEGAQLIIGTTGKPGMLKAVGTETNRILFTSNQAVKTLGWWKNIRFTSEDSGSVMKYCTVEYGGGEYANIYTDGAQNLTISNCKIINSEGSGVIVYHEANNSFINFENNIITNNTDYGIVLHADQVRGIAADNKLSGNGADGKAPGVKIHSGSYVKNNATWHKLDTPYLFSKTYVADENGVTLTIEPGTEFWFTPDGFIQIGDYNPQFGDYNGSGKLIAIGEVNAPILFTAAQAGSMWDGLQFGPNDAGSVLKYCTIEYGGKSSLDANISVTESPNLSISNCSITNSGGSGVMIDYLPSLTADVGSAVSFENNIITDNAEYGIQLHADQVRGIAADNKVSGNGVDGKTPGIKIHSGTYVRNDATWHKLDTPYLIHTMSISDPNDAILTIEAGVEIRFIEWGYIEVGDCSYYDGSGRILAKGTAGEPILFTSSQEQKTSGAWQYIKFNAEDSGSVLEYCTIEYGGGDGSFLEMNFPEPCNVFVNDAASVKLLNCNIRNSHAIGISIIYGGYGVSADITGTKFSSNKCDVYRGIREIDDNNICHHVAKPIGVGSGTTYCYESCPEGTSCFDMEPSEP